jgi:D-beta-D-heptose 7-phosphate kinase/D-beta-D-heptose 1-phosphate adenosyltransferase
MADHTHQIVRVDHEVSSPADSRCEAELGDEAELAIARADVLVLSDYEKGTLTAEVARRAIEAARARQMPIVVNAKPATLAHYAGATLVQLNRAEASAALGFRELLDVDQAEAEAARLRERFGLEGVLVTLGPAGMVALRVGGDPIRVSAPKVEVFDTAGAGDTAVAAVGLGLATTGFRPETFEFAAYAASRVVAKAGVAVPSDSDFSDLVP